MGQLVVELSYVGEDGEAVRRMVGHNVLNIKEARNTKILLSTGEC